MKYGILIVIFLLSCTQTYAQDRTPFRIFTEINVGSNINHPLPNLGIDYLDYSSRDFAINGLGGVYIGKNTIGGIGVRFDRLQLKVLSNDVSPIEFKIVGIGTGVLIYFQQNLRLKKVNKFGGFIRLAFSQISFDINEEFLETDLITGEETRKDLMEFSQKIGLFINPSLGFNYNLNEVSRLTLEASLEGSISQIIELGPRNFAEAAIMRRFTTMLFIRVGFQRDLFWGRQ